MARQHLVVHGTDLDQLGVCDALAGQLAAGGFQRAHHLEQVVDRFLGQHHHLGAPVWQQCDQAITREHLECLPQRGARDLEQVAQHALIEPGTGRQIAFHDHGAQALGHRHMQDLAVYGLRGSGRIGGHQGSCGLTVLYSKPTLGQARTAFRCRWPRPEQREGRSEILINTDL
ncbi:hypothetical protein D3C72_1527380 [compost metagenome]